MLGVPFLVKNTSRLTCSTDLQQSKAHPNAVPGALSEGQECIWCSGSLALGAEVFGVKGQRVWEVPLILHDGTRWDLHQHALGNGEVSPGDLVYIEIRAFYDVSRREIVNINLQK